MKTTQKITTDTLAKDAMFARNILDTQKDAGKLSSYATNWQRVGARTNNSMLCDLATEAHRRGRAYKFDAVMPARANQMFARYGYAQTALRLVTQTQGNDMFHTMCELGLVEYTADYIVYTHMADLLSAKVYQHVALLLIDADVDVQI
jgi:hypothetical protein